MLKEWQRSCDSLNVNKHGRHVSVNIYLDISHIFKKLQSHTIYNNHKYLYLHHIFFFFHLEVRKVHHSIYHYVMACNLETEVNVFLSVENCSNLKLGGGKISFKTVAPVFIVNSSGEAFNKQQNVIILLRE